MTTTDIDLNDPAVQARIDSMIRDAAQSFDEWAKTANYAVHVASALKEADAAAADAPREGRGRAWATIEITTRSKPLVRGLLAQGFAAFDEDKLNVQINFEDRHRLSPLSVRFAAVEAFVLALSRPGFEFEIFTDKPLGTGEKHAQD